MYSKLNSKMFHLMPNNHIFAHVKFELFLFFAELNVPNPDPLTKLGWRTFSALKTICTLRMGMVEETCVSHGIRPWIVAIKHVKIQGATPPSERIWVKAVIRSICIILTCYISQLNGIEIQQYPISWHIRSLESLVICLRKTWIFCSVNNFNISPPRFLEKTHGGLDFQPLFLGVHKRWERWAQGEQTFPEEIQLLLGAVFTWEYVNLTRQSFCWGKGGGESKAENLFHVWNGQITTQDFQTPEQSENPDFSA